MCVCVFIHTHLPRDKAEFLKVLTGSPLLAILLGGTQVSMTPDCFVCPLTSLRGPVVNQALHARGKSKGGEGCGDVGHFLCKDEVQKVPLYIRFVAEQKVGSL